MLTQEEAMKRAQVQIADQDARRYAARLIESLRAAGRVALAGRIAHLAQELEPRKTDPFPIQEVTTPPWAKSGPLSK